MWSVGDKCMAPFSEDDKNYRATIQSITTDCQGNKRATVKFSGYTSDENETVDVTRLKTRSVRRPHRSGTGNESSFTSVSSGSGDTGTSFTSPLRYMPEHDRLRDKFSDLLDETASHSNSALSVRKSPCESQSVSKTALRRKYAVAIGGNIKECALTCTPMKTTSLLGSIQSPGTSHPTQLSCDTSSLDDINEGFSSGDLERPYFPNSSNQGPKVPLLLSDPDTEPVVQVPATINRYLRDYQRDGVKFLYSHFRKNGGAILGDDMGLGKTVQVLAFLCAVLGKTGTKEDCQRRLPEFLQKKLKTFKCQSTDVYLIVCPTTVLYNWLDEFETWTYCTTGKYHGKDRRETSWKAMKGKLDVVLTTYETYRIYIDELDKIKWTAVFVDEVHKIKAPKSLITGALKNVNTMRRYGLTGTAIQNEMTELWCVLDWANPNCLGPLQKFKDDYEHVINKGQRFDASKRELAEGRQTSLKFSRLRTKWMLRRTKALIADQLPTKEEKVVFCNMTELQLSVYKALLESDDLQQLVLRQHEMCDCGSQAKRGKCCYKENAQGIYVRALTFSFMTLLTKVSNHVALLSPETKMSDLQQHTVKTYCDIAFARHPQFIQLSKEARFCTLSDPKYCGKMQVLVKLLDVFKKNDSKVLLFSHYTQLLDILEMYLKTTDYVYRRLDGKTPAHDRQKYVHEFNKDTEIFLFLISTKAGGQGLNLTGANVVIIYDPTWNPTYDLQAQDRAYRIGQHRDVAVYRLISTGSIEENMYLRQIYKQQIASVAMESENAKRYFTGVAGSKSGELFGLRNMFELRTGDCILTKDLIERESKTIKGITMAKYIPLAVAEPEVDAQKQGQKQTNSANQDIVDAEEDGNYRNDADEDLEDESLVGDEDDNNDDGGHDLASQLIISDESDMEAPEVKTRLKQRVDDSDSTFGLADRSVCKTKNKEECRHDSEHEGQKRKRHSKSILRRDGRIVSRVKGRRAHQGATFDRQGAEPDSSEDSDQSQSKMAGTQRARIKPHGVDDVLRECGVSFVHSNKTLVGSSKVEDHVSTTAMRDVFELDQYSQEPANCNVPTLDETGDSLNTPTEKGKVDQSLSSVYHDLPSNQSKPLSYKVNNTTILIGQTPRGIRRHHFKELAKTKGFSTASDLAKHIFESSLEDQASMLQYFYSDKHPDVDFKTYFELVEEQEPKTPEPKVPHRTRQTSNKSQRKKIGKKVTQPGRCIKKKQSRMRPQRKGCQWESGSEDEEQPNEHKNVHLRRKRRCNSDEGETSSSDIEVMDTHESDEEIKAGKMGDGFTDLRQPSVLVESKQDLTAVQSGAAKQSSSKAKEGKRLSSNIQFEVSQSQQQEQNLSFLDDIFLTSSASKKIRKPPPKRKQSPGRLQQHTDTLWVNEPEGIVKHMCDDDTLADSSGRDFQNPLWRRNSKYGQKQEQIDAALEEENSNSVFHKYSSSFVTNKRYKRKFYKFDVEKDQIFSETLSSE